MVSGIKLTEQEVDFRVKSVHGNTVVRIGSYISKDVKIEFRDIDHGSWFITPANVWNGHGHPNRGQQKQKDTMMTNWGVENPSFSKEIVNRISESQILDPDVFRARLMEIHDGRVSLVGKQTAFSIKTEFNDIEYGIWSATPTNVLMGHGHPTRGRLNGAKKSKRATQITHWRCGSILTAEASYELATIKWLNSNKINYEWQKHSFKTAVLTAKGKISSYTPDFYLPDENLWVEIKGYFLATISKEKWDWFHKNYPNSELWTKDVLIKKGILNVRGL